MRSDLVVDVMAPGALDTALRVAWERLRASNADLWSPFFDIRFTQFAGRFAPHAHVAVVRRAGEIVAFLPFQGRKGGWARALGAPLADHHGMICAPDEAPDLGELVRAAGLAGFGYTGLAGPIQAGDAVSQVHVADMRQGLKAWQQARQHHGEHLKKAARRIRQGEREWGAMRVEATRGDTAMLARALAWKSERLTASARHDIMSTPWIRSLLEALHASADPDFHAEVWTLHFGDSLAAVEYGMRCGGVVHSWFPSYDLAFSKVSPGTLLMEAMIETAGARGDSRVDLGAGFDHYKKYASNALVPRGQGRVRAPGARTAVVTALDSASAMLGRLPLKGLSTVEGRIRRRAEQVLAAEPTFGGRVKGFAAALRAARPAG